MHNKECSSDHGSSKVTRMQKPQPSRGPGADKLQLDFEQCQSRKNGEDHAR